MADIDPVADIARSVLYEGFSLHPARASGVFPPAWARANPGDAHEAGAQMLLQGYDYTVVRACIRFLQFDALGNATERCVDVAPHVVGELFSRPHVTKFDLGEIRLSATPVDDAFRIDLRVRSTCDCTSALREEVLPLTMTSLHAIVRVADGTWISLLEPPAALDAAARTCMQDGLHPVLAGRNGAHDTMLASPIVLGDYP